MLVVSDNWKAAHTEMLLPETFLEINCLISEPGLGDEANVSVTGAADYSNHADLANSTQEIGSRYTTLEWNAWGLDGNTEYHTGNVQGYVGSIASRVNTDYVTNPTITLTFDSVHTTLIPGMTIYWSESFEEWAESFRITVYNGNSVVITTEITENTDIVSTVWFEFQNFDRIVVEVLKWCLPYRRTRILAVVVGIEAKYTKNDLLGYTHTQSVDLLSATLPKSEVVFQLDNSDDKWNPENPSGVEKYLMERQEIRVRYGMRVEDTVEWLNAAKLWLSEWSTPANGIEARFTARDAVQFMSDVYTGPKRGTLLAIAEAALGQISLDGGSLEYVLDASLANYSADFADSTTQYTVSNILQMVAHAACCVFYSDENGVIHIQPRGTSVTDYEILPSVSYSHPEYTLSKPLKAVSVSYGGETTSVDAGSVGEIQTVSNDLIASSEVATNVANTTIAVLENRKTITGEYRADPRLEALDVVTVQNKYTTNQVVITEIKYSTTGGALRGTYTGRVLDQ